MSKRLPGSKGDRRRMREQQRGADFAAGVEAAKVELAPLLMRRFFTRGLLGGLAVGTLFGYVLGLWL